MDEPNTIHSKTYNRQVLKRYEHLIKICDPGHPHPKRLAKIIAGMPRDLPQFIRNIYEQGRMMTSLAIARNWCITIADSVHTHHKKSNCHYSWLDQEVYVRMCTENLI